MATAGVLHPSEGIRMLLVRESAAGDGSSAVYRASIYTPTDHMDYRGELVAGGGATLTAIGDAADAEHEKRLLNLARSTARAAARNTADGLPPWPDRINRWRGPGRG